MKKDEERIILNNCCFDTELERLRNTPEEEFQSLYEEAKEELMNLDESLCEPLFIKIIAIALLENDFSKDLVIERQCDYIEAKKFLESDDHEEIYQEYGLVIPKIDNEYSINRGEKWKNEIVKKKILAKEGFTSEGEALNDVAEIINQKWRDKSQMITSERLNQFTQNDEGINFKQFLFCEEYLKTGKVKSTCELLGIGRTTAYNYLNEKEVQEYLKKRRDEMQKENQEIRKQAFNECFEILQDIFSNRYNQDTDRIKSIDIYLKHYENIYMKKETGEEE